MLKFYLRTSVFSQGSYYFFGGSLYSATPIIVNMELYIHVFLSQSKLARSLLIYTSSSCDLFFIGSYKTINTWLLDALELKRTHCKQLPAGTDWQLDVGGDEK